MRSVRLMCAPAATNLYEYLPPRRHPMPTMQAIEIIRPGGPDVLQRTARPILQAGLGEVLIKAAPAASA
ncbi:MAG: hypothetical protein ACYCZD_01045 [Rhodanobacter sp.]